MTATPFIEIEDEVWIPANTVVQVRSGAIEGTFIVETAEREYVVKGRPQDFILRIGGHLA